MKPERTCPDCGATLPADAPRGLCPNCLMGAALPSTSPSSHGATGIVEPAGPGVLDTIAQSIGTVPRVLLRDTAPGETPGPVVRPDATDADPSIRYRIDGEILREEIARTVADPADVEDEVRALFAALVR